jgi:DnaJ-class molecular chaperone
MDPFDQPEPRISDYYTDLGLPQQASFRDVKLAFFKLAKKHHPDKKAPGMSIDAQDFRKVSL